MARLSRDCLSVIPQQIIQRGVNRQVFKLTLNMNIVRHHKIIG